MREPKKKPLSLILFMAGLVLLPYDSVSYIIPSFYAPVSLIVFTLYCVVYTVAHRRIQLNRGWLRFLPFYGFAVISGAVIVAFRREQFPVFKEFLLTLTIGLGMLLALTTGMREYREHYGAEWPERFMKLLGWAYLLPLIVGFVELLSLRGLLPGSVKEAINRFFTGGGCWRLAITTHEASWAANQMIMASGAYLCCFVWTKKKIWILPLVGSLFLFVMTMSAQGIGVMLIGLVLWAAALLVRMKDRKKALRNLVFMIAGLAAGLAALYLLLHWLPDGYYVKRLLAFSSVEQALASDNSVFMRVGLLAVHLLIFLNHWIIGVGGGGFRLFAWETIARYFPASLGLDEVNAFRGGVASTEMSFYFSVLSEQGIIGLLLFGWFWLRSFRNVCRIQRTTLILFICMLLAFPVQHGSWALIPFWLAIAMLNLYEPERTE